MKTKLLHGLLILSLLFSLLYVPRSAEAAAPDFGRGMDQWYFTGQSDFDAHQLFTESPDIPYEGFMPFPYSYPDNYMDADSFIEAIRIRLWSPTDFNRARAAALVNMMLGIDGNDAAFNGPSPERWRNGVTVAQARFDEMKALVYAYDAAGRANFNAIYYEENPKDWSGAVAGYDASGNIIPANDSIHHTLSEVINGPTVEFYAADHTPLMIILKNCANLLGDTKPLDLIDDPTPCVGGISPSISTPSVNEAFDIVMKINANVGGPGNVQISGPASWSGNPAFTYDGATSQSSATISYTPPSPGRYTVTWDAPTISPACSANFVVYNKPYFSVFSGDVQVGAAFPGAALGAEASNAQIWAFNNGGQGAGTQLAAMAIGTINQFGSAYNSAQPGGAPYNKLTFANTAGVYGGSFGAGGASVVPDYKQLFTLNGVTPIVGNHTIGPADTVINPGAANAQDVFVQGDVYITGRIVYAGSGTWTLNNMPSYRLVVEGNIYIASGVTQLDGIYVALPNGAGGGGNIYTCANGFGAPNAAFVAANCGNKLTVNGAFIADKVRLLRSGGGVHQAGGAETAGSSNAAEVFVYGPETWLTAPKYAPTQGYGYDSITSLPPVLYRN